MSGVDARDGFWFQDARILVRLLRDATARRLLTLGGLTAPPAIRIKIEAATEVPSDAASLAAPRPLWDSVSLESTALIVDETKLGDVSKAERLSFYARLRGTAASRGSVAGLVPRLTTATGAQTNEEKWRGLAHASVAAPVPAAAPTTVNTADELAQEALFYLTSPQLPSRKRNNRDELVDAVTPQMPEPDARALLERFLFDDELDLSATESELRRLLEEVGANPLVDESVRHLRGWIAEKACARPEGAEMSCETLCDDLTIVARYLRVRPESERLLRRLRDARAPAIETRIPVREWRDVQPAVASSVDSAGSTRVVLTGFGGLGKSFLLSQLEKDLRQSDVCLWIDATSAVDVGLLAEAVELAAWVATHSGRRLSVLIDGLDQATGPLTLLSSVHEGLAGTANAIVVTAARPATWSAIAVTSDLWRAVHLERWSIESVTQLSFAPMLPPDLVDLLRTPLLLDLYLRTITNEDPKFFRPTSRHELIADYFLRRVLPAGATSSPIRRSLLARLGAKVAAGELQWGLDSADAAVAAELVGEGLLLDTFGRFRFRHPLLQDVCVSMALGSIEPEVCITRLSRVDSATLRHDAMRSLIEASTTTGERRALVDVPPLSSLLRGLLDSGLPAIDSLGDVVVSAADLPSVLGTGSGLAAILKWARSAGNRSWLHALAKQPVFPRPRWLLPAAIDDDLYELARDVSYTTLADNVARELALRMRSWAAQDLVPHGWAAISVISAVLHRCPTGETLQWLDSLPGLPDSGVCDLLGGLRAIAAQDGELDEAMLARLVLRGFDNVGLARGGPRPRTGDKDEGTTQVIMECLQSGDRLPGLFQTRPRAAFRVLFELSARHGEARHRDNLERSKDPKHIEMMEELGRLLGGEEGTDESDPPAGPVPSEVDAGIVNDVPPIGWRPDAYPLHGIWVSAAQRLNDPAIMKIAREEAAQSRSLAARNLVAGNDALVGESSGWVRHEVSPWPDDPLPPGTPEQIGRAWHLLEIIARARSGGVRSTIVSEGTLRTVLASADLLASTPTWALQSLHIVIHDFTKHADPTDLAAWCDRLLQWLEQGPLDQERAAGAFECFEDCFFGLESREQALVERFVGAFKTQLAASVPVEQAKLFFAAHRMTVYPVVGDLLLTFARSHPETDALRSIWLAVANTPHVIFLDIARELVALSPHSLPDQTQVDIGIRLGAASCYATSLAWEVVSDWLTRRPNSGTCRDDGKWRSLLDSIANGATHHATNDVTRYAQVATGLWNAWVTCPSQSVHGLVYLLFACIKPAKSDKRRALVDTLAPLAVDIVAAGDAFDLLGLDKLPWSEMSSQDLTNLVDGLIARIVVGPPEPDEYRRVASALDDLIKSLATSNALSGREAERLYDVVKPAAWLPSREARCQELHARAQSVSR